MANEEFSLSFTLSAPADFNDFGEGTVGEAGTVFSDILTTTKTGEAGTIFADLITQTMIGEAGTIFVDIVTTTMTGEASTANTDGLCFVDNILSFPGQSILSGTPSNIASCP